MRVARVCPSRTVAVALNVRVGQSEPVAVCDGMDGLDADVLDLDGAANRVVVSGHEAVAQSVTQADLPL